MSDPFTSLGKEVLANGFHYADAANETAAKHLVMALNDRAAIIAWLRNAVTHSPAGEVYGWDSETRSYARSFADDIASGRHLTTPSTEGQGA